MNFLIRTFVIRAFVISTFVISTFVISTFVIRTFAIRTFVACGAKAYTIKVTSMQFSDVRLTSWVVVWLRFSG